MHSDSLNYVSIPSVTEFIPALAVRAVSPLLVTEQTESPGIFPTSTIIFVLIISLFNLMLVASIIESYIKVKRDTRHHPIARTHTAIQSGDKEKHEKIELTDFGFSSGTGSNDRLVTVGAVVKQDTTTLIPILKPSYKESTIIKDVINFHVIDIKESEFNDLFPKYYYRKSVFILESLLITPETCHLPQHHSLFETHPFSNAIGFQTLNFPLPPLAAKTNQLHFLDHQNANDIGFKPLPNVPIEKDMKPIANVIIPIRKQSLR